MPDDIEGKEKEFEKNQTEVKTKKQKKQKQKKENVALWILFIFIFSISLTVAFSFLSEVVMSDAIWVCAIVTFALIFINVICDLLSVAVTSTPIEPFLAMASSKVKGARRAVSFVKNADKFSSICADVCGDVCGIVSGTASTAIVTAICATAPDNMTLVISIAISAIVGGLTVGGKALGKVIAVRSSRSIVLGFAKFTTIFKREK